MGVHQLPPLFKPMHVKSRYFLINLYLLKSLLSIIKLFFFNEGINIAKPKLFYLWVGLESGFK